MSTWDIYILAYCTLWWVH